MRRILALTLPALLASTLAPATPARAASMDELAWYGMGQVSLPFGDFGDFAGFGGGVGVGAILPYTAELQWRGEVSFLKYSGESFGDFDYGIWMLPIVALAEWTPQPDSPFYALGGLGIFYRSISVDYNGPSSIFIDSSSADDSDTDIGLVLGGGFHANEQFMLEGRLHLISDTNHLTLGASYLF